MKKKLYKILLFFILIVQISTISQSNNLEKTVVPDTNSRACIVIDRNTNTILFINFDNPNLRRYSL